MNTKQVKSKEYLTLQEQTSKEGEKSYQTETTEACEIMYSELRENALNLELIPS